MARGDEWKNGKVPLAYEDQCRYGMWITGLEFGEVINLRSGRWTTDSIYAVEHSDGWCQAVGLAVLSMWNNVVTDIPPVFSGKDEGSLWRETLGRVVASLESKPQEIVADEEQVELIEKYHKVVDEIKELTETAEQLKAAFASVLAEGEGSIVSQAGTVVWKKTAGSSTFDRKTFEKENPELAPRYIKKGDPSMRMTFKW
jgi:hypothetical protein